MSNIQQAQPNEVAFLLTVAMSATHSAGNQALNMRLKKYAMSLGFTDEALVAAAKNSAFMKPEPPQ